MPVPNVPKPLYRIDECPDLMADGCVGDENGNLVFLSIWARDTAVQQFLARLTLGRDEQGLDQFHIVNAQGGVIPVFVGNVENLEKRSTRAYRRTLFGSLTNLWLFDAASGPTRPTRARWPCCHAMPLTGSIGCGRWCRTPARCRCSITGATSCWSCCTAARC
jgi:hypothetical protein